MAKYKYNEKIEKIWEKAHICNCRYNDCHPNAHRLCAICLEPIMYGAHESIKSQKNSFYSWNIDHKIPISRGGTNQLSNLQAVHIRCNRFKKNN